jgi:hypothetical protein
VLLDAIKVFKVDPLEYSGVDLWSGLPRSFVDRAGNVVVVQFEIHKSGTAI